MMAIKALCLKLFGVVHRKEGVDVESIEGWLRRQRLRWLDVIQRGEAAEVGRVLT